MAGGAQLSSTMKSQPLVDTSQLPKEKMLPILRQNISQWLTEMNTNSTQRPGLVATLQTWACLQGIHNLEEGADAHPVKL